MLSEKADYQHLSNEADDDLNNVDNDLDLPELDSPTGDCKDEVLLSDPLRESEPQRRPTWLPSWASKWKLRPSYKYEEGFSRDLDVEKATREEEADDSHLLSSRSRAKCFNGPHWRWIALPLPSFLHRFIVNVETPKNISRLTDYLDGIRGVASLFVFFDHCRFLSLCVPTTQLTLF